MRMLLALLAIAHSTLAFTDVCNAFSSHCITCAQHPSGDCGFCGDGLYAPEDDVQPGARVGGWIFKQRGLDSPAEQEDAPVAQIEAAAPALTAAQEARRSAEVRRDHARAQAAAALAESALLVEQLHGGGSSSASSSSKSAARHAVSHGFARAASGIAVAEAASLLEVDASASKTGHTADSAHEGGAGRVGAMLSDALAAAAHAASAPLAAAAHAAGLHVPAPAPARRPHHFLGCFNRTAAAAGPLGGQRRIASPIARMCRDFRTDACDCEGADKGERALPACAVVAAQVRTPIAVVATALGAAAAVVSAVLLAQAQYMRCLGKR